MHFRDFYNQLSQGLSAAFGRSVGALGSKARKTTGFAMLGAWMMLGAFTGAVGAAFGAASAPPAPRGERPRSARMRRYYQFVVGKTQLAGGALLRLKTRLFAKASALKDDSPESAHLARMLERLQAEYMQEVHAFNELNTRIRNARARVAERSSLLSASRERLDTLRHGLGEDDVFTPSELYREAEEHYRDADANHDIALEELDQLEQEAIRAITLIDRMAAGMANVQSGLQTTRINRRLEQVGSGGKTLAIGAIVLIVLSSLVRRVRAESVQDIVERTSRDFNMHTTIVAACAIIATCLCCFLSCALYGSRGNMEAALNRSEARFAAMQQQIIQATQQVEVTAKEVEKAAKPIAKVATTVKTAMEWHAMLGAAVVIYGLLRALYKRLRNVKKEVREGIVSPAEKQILTGFDTVALVLAGVLFVKGGASAGKRAWSAMHTITTMMGTACGGIRLLADLFGSEGGAMDETRWVEDVSKATDELQTRSAKKLIAANLAKRKAAEAAKKNATLAAAIEAASEEPAPAPAPAEQAPGPAPANIVEAVDEAASTSQYDSALAVSEPEEEKSVEAPAEAESNSEDEGDEDTPDDTYYNAIKSVWSDPSELQAVQKVRSFFLEYPAAKPFVLIGLFAGALVLARWVWTRSAGPKKFAPRDLKARLAERPESGKAPRMKRKGDQRKSKKNRQVNKNRPKVWIDYDPSTGEPLNIGFVDELGNVSAAVGRRAQRTAANHLAQIHDRWGLYADVNADRKLINESCDHNIERVIINEQVLDPRVIADLSQYDFAPLTDAQLDDENFPIYQLPTGFIFVALPGTTDKVSESSDDEEVEESKAEVKPKAKDVLEATKSAKGAKKHAKALEKSAEKILCKFCKSHKSVADGGHFAREDDKADGAPVCRGLIKHEQKKAAGKSKEQAEAQLRAPIFQPSKSIKAMGWMVVTDGIGDTRGNIFCIALNGIITPRHTIGAAGPKKHEVTFYYRDLVFSPELKSYPIGNDLLWWPMPKQLAPLIADHTALNASMASAPITAGETVMLLAFANLEASKSGSVTVSTGNVATVDLTVDNEKATYTPSSVMGNCGGIVLNKHSQCVGWHIGTLGDINTFIPLHAGMVARSQKPELSVF